MLPDHWNPRLWLRDWLLKPGRAESGCGKQLPGSETIDPTTLDMLSVSGAELARMSADRKAAASRTAQVDAAQLSALQPGASFELHSRAGDALVIRVPFDSEAAWTNEFWAPIAATPGDGKPSMIGWVRFSRRTVISSMALFEATELRLACTGELDPEPVLQVSMQLLREGT
ncbi:TPA: hypothetical protein UOA91_002901 [Stenotrophomonas maltophilia]|nr:hypothetical protein [Stenotrophomonas maltophilia]HEL3778669.1 hypothetical protein [Stenotrophomonas maltophilia]HEL5006662.1 hypothetical protein [Stenotrophomonas maltophilia]